MPLLTLIKGRDLIMKFFLFAIFLLSTFSLFSDGVTYWDYTIIEGNEIRLLGSVGRGVIATSVLKPNITETDPFYDEKLHRYTSDKAFDNNLTTAWVEGKKDEGIGEKIIFVIPEGTTLLEIANGLQTNEKLFKDNNRIKDFSITLYFGFHYSFSQMGPVFYFFPYNSWMKKYSFKDSMGYQSFPINIDWKDFNFKGNEKLKTLSDDLFTMGKRQAEAILMIEIKSVYKGDKYNDTAISEIRVK